MKLGYNTNGLAHHRWQEGLALLAEIGYQSVAITVDHNCLDPYAPQLPQEIDQMRRLLEQFGLSSVIETGARFLLNPRVKHEPTLMCPTVEERRVRVDFLKRCVDIADELHSEALSLWSGTLRDTLSFEAAMQRLADGCREVLEYASQKEVRLAFEPEPGMFIERLSQYDELANRLESPLFGLTVDIGHVHCVEDISIADCLRQWSTRLFNIHIEDMRRGVHEHLCFGDGEIDFSPVLSALDEIGYRGGVHVELSRHSHIAPKVMREAYQFLQDLCSDPSGRENGKVP